MAIIVSSFSLMNGTTVRSSSQIYLLLDKTSHYTYVSHDAGITIAWFQRLDIIIIEDD